MEHQWEGDATVNQITWEDPTWEKAAKATLVFSNWTKHVRKSYKETAQALMTSGALLRKDNGCAMNDAMDGQKLVIKNYIFAPSRIVSSVY